ncbi:MAG: helix-turn-helix domain-containing protein [Proteobacteria bacterium]|nr:helix-turn-helix domain-containing protein [Pseudomonadota bacterium]
MTKPAATPSLADRDAAEGGVAAVDRAMTILAAFSGTAPVRTLAEIAAYTQLYKSTLLRLLASLEHARLVVRQADGRWALGAEVARLHQVYAKSVSLADVVMPALRELSETTQESAAFHVRQGEHRLALHRVDSPRPVRDSHQPGELLPLDRGAGGRVLMAYAGARGARYAKIRREQVVTSVGDRVPELAGVSAPVFGVDGALVGALTLTMPAERLQPDYGALVLAAAKKLTTGLGGRFPPPASG